MADSITTNEIMEFLQENMVTKDEMKAFVRGELQQTESRILTGLDRFVKLHETLDQELVALRSKYDRLEERMEVIEHKLGLATS